jgi:hypothetical protein
MERVNRLSTRPASFLTSRKFPRTDFIRPVVLVAGSAESSLAAQVHEYSLSTFERELQLVALLSEGLSGSCAFAGAHRQLRLDIHSCNSSTDSLPRIRGFPSLTTLPGEDRLPSIS